jgi:hypothetical protein
VTEKEKVSCSGIEGYHLPEQHKKASRKKSPSQALFLQQEQSSQ